MYCQKYVVAVAALLHCRPSRAPQENLPLLHYTNKRARSKMSVSK